MIWNGRKWRLAWRGEIRVGVDGEVVSNRECSSRREREAETVQCARAALVVSWMLVVGACMRVGGRRGEWAEESVLATCCLEGRQLGFTESAVRAV